MGLRSAGLSRHVVNEINQQTTARLWFMLDPNKMNLKTGFTRLFFLSSPIANEKVEIENRFCLLLPDTQHTNFHMVLDHH
jgi:hypothetical protein